ncbi:hypothetical protein LJB99_02015 [Deltaproteobacteria bacterium OttesenSCG-928-K17]|nr:hypothetical protein [Deltaproteobacteria bacterium OttesenSCG-928-K17]
MLSDSDKYRGGYFFKLAAMLLMAAWPFCFSQAAMAEENIPAADDYKAAPCKGLKPYNSLDELLYQFYINLESDCLFTMPVEDLEKIWGVKILAKERAQGQSYSQVRDSVDFRNKPYLSEKDAFFIELNQGVLSTNKNLFTIVITREYFEKYGSLFPEGNIPWLLPEPKIEEFIPRPRVLNRDELKNPPKQHKCKKNWSHGYRYYWSSPGRPYRITIEGGCVVTEITVY